MDRRYRIRFVRKSQPNNEAETVVTAHSVNEARDKFYERYSEKHFRFVRAIKITVDDNRK